jgi:CheY-like chemotaxis protein
LLKRINVPNGAGAAPEAVAFSGRNQCGNAGVAAGGILIVEDNEINRDICAINLKQLDVPLFFAANGIEGLRLAREKQPDLILLDVMMPEMDGFEMLKVLKREEPLSNIPVLMLSAKAETASVVSALEIGANDYLRKPFAEEEMVARVHTLLRNRYLEKRLAEDLAAGAMMQRKFLTDFMTTDRMCQDFGLAVDIFNRPYAAISGDFFYTFSRVGGELGFFLGDSCGHGLPAALISMRVAGLLQQLADTSHSAGEILALLNDDICGVLPLGRFVAASVLIFNGDEVNMSNGGQPYPILLSAGEVVEIEQNNLPLGLNCGNPYGETTFSLKRGDKLLVCTDGISEATNNDQQGYGRERLLACLRNVPSAASGSHCRQAILDDIAAFAKSAMPDDDQTLLIFTRK